MSEASQFVILAVPLLLLLAVAARALYARRNEPPAATPAKSPVGALSETARATPEEPATPLAGWQKELLVMLAIVLVVIAGGALWFLNLLSHAPY